MEFFETHVGTFVNILFSKNVAETILFLEMVLNVSCQNCLLQNISKYSLLVTDR